jgi:pimeloyl-ACP methyl ester carboxylesterase
MPHRRRPLLLAALLAIAGCADAAGISEAGRPSTGETEPAADVDAGDGDGTASSTTPPVDVDDPLRGFVPAPLSWTRCGDGLECARLEVPLDWDDPGGETIELAVAKQPGTAAEPEGAIITNPGGPGASGNEFIAGGVFSERIDERFDTISWDPRGVAGTEPLGCSGEELTRFIRIDHEPDDAAEDEALDAAARALADRCAATSPTLLPHLGTGSAARDLEAIRRAYVAGGGGRTAYIGFSYGTAIGLEYLELFPGAMPVVIDGVIDPSLSLTDFLRSQTVAFDRIIAGILASCPAGEPGCPPGGAAAAYDRLAAEIDVAPLPSGADLLGPADLTTAAMISTYDASLEPVFLYALDFAVRQGDGSLLMQMAVGYRFFTSYAAYWAVECLDSVNPVGSEAWDAFAAELAAISPRFGAAIANEMRPCAFWPVPPDPITGPVVAEGAGPVVVIGTTGDAATPLPQAEAAAAGLADGRLIVYDGPGHTAYLSSDCVQDHVDAFLLDGIAPPDGTRC